MIENNLEAMRHSLSHVMAQAVLRFYPKAKLAIGPSIDNGFYYDFDLEKEVFKPDDLIKIEKEMRRIINHGIEFKQVKLKIVNAKKKLKGSPYKLELLKELEMAGEKEISFYQSVDQTGKAEFEDMCLGPHVESAKQIGAFKIHKLAGAYWRGDEKNKMLQRIYGLAFATKAELEKYLKILVEAEKRDHRKLGAELELFAFHETAPGMPYWLPKGVVILNELINFWRVEHAGRGYQEICSPLVNKKELWEKSGHWDHYKADMFIADMGEGEVYGIKPMNCPNAMIVYGLQKRSYRDLPLRFSDTDTLHRYERSGTMSGLLRVRSFRQDDSHNFITEDQIESEFEQIFQIANKFYGIFNLKFKYRLGTRPEQFIGDKKTWDDAERKLRCILDKTAGVGNYLVAEGDAAFYGPKIDIIMKDCLDRDWQLGTIQLDFQIPKRFDLVYTDKNGKDQTPVVVHRVIYGSLERFIGVIIEHYAGAFPLWLAPVQVKILPISEKYEKYGQAVFDELKKSSIRVELDNSNESLGKKIRNGEKEKIPYILVIGEKEEKDKIVAVRQRGKGDLGAMDLKDFIAQAEKEIAGKI